MILALMCSWICLWSHTNESHEGPGNKCLHLVTGWQETATGSRFTEPVQAYRILAQSYLCSAGQQGMCSLFYHGRWRKNPWKAGSEKKPASFQNRMTFTLWKVTDVSTLRSQSSQALFGFVYLLLGHEQGFRWTRDSRFPCYRKGW